MEFINLINRKYISEQDNLRPLNFAYAAQYLTLDVITTLSYGKAFGYCANDADIHGYIETVEKSIAVMMIVTALPMFSKLLSSALFRKLVLPSPNDTFGIGKALG